MRENSQSIRLVVGLGNPGLQYRRTRHNAGFMVLERIALAHHVEFHKSKWGLLGQTAGVWLLKPMTFMNLSGNAVAPFMKMHGISPDQLLVVADDLDLRVGMIRIRRSGSSGGHNGLKSLIQMLGTEEFARLRIGISRPPLHVPVVDWVLRGFSRDEWATLDTVLDAAAQAVETIWQEGLEVAMNRYNRFDR